LSRAINFHHTKNSAARNRFIYLLALTAPPLRVGGLKPFGRDVAFFQGCGAGVSLSCD
jgi:hypothetical protein